MSKRMDALWRVVAFVWSLVAAFIVQFILLFAMLWGAIDVLWQLIVGSDGLSSTSTLGSFINDSLYWPVDNMVYAFTGSGGLEWLP